MLKLKAIPMVKNVFKDYLIIINCTFHMLIVWITTFSRKVFSFSVP